MNLTMEKVAPPGAGGQIAVEWEFPIRAIFFLFLISILLLSMLLKCSQVHAEEAKQSEELEELKQKCKKDDSEACVAYGLALYKSNPQQYRQSLNDAKPVINVLQKACTLKNEKGCALRKSLIEFIPELQRRTKAKMEASAEGEEGTPLEYERQREYELLMMRQQMLRQQQDAQRRALEPAQNLLNTWIAPQEPSRQMLRQRCITRRIQNGFEEPKYVTDCD